MTKPVMRMEITASRESWQIPYPWRGKGEIQGHLSNPNEVDGTQRPGCQRDPATRKGGATSWLPETPPGRSLPIVFQKGILVMDNAL